MSPVARVHTPLARFGQHIALGAARSLRIIAYFACVFAVISGLGLRSVHGAVGEAALAMGRQLAHFEDIVRTSHRVRLNGEPVNLASAVVDAPLVSVLDRFERACESGSVVPAEFKEMVRAAHAGSEHSVKLGTGVLRRESTSEGLVACIVRDEHQPPSLRQRIARFEETLDLSDVGLFRYAYAQKTASGRVHLLVAWTDGPFRLAALMGDGTQDAPGEDVPNAARPIQSVRLLSASIERTPHASHVYASSAAPARVLSAFDTDMQRLGWKSLPVSDVVEGRAYSRRGVDVLVFGFPSERGSVVSIVQSRQR